MKLRINHLLLIAVVIVFVLTSMTCTPGVQYRDVVLTNLSNDTIYVTCLCHTNDIDDYFDARFVFETLSRGLLDTLASDSSSMIKVPSWDYDRSVEYNRNWFNSMVLTALVFKKSTIDKYGVDYIIKNNIIDNKIQYLYNDVKKDDFKIYYTGE